MTGRQLGIIQSSFIQCFKNIAVFKRSESDGQYFEANDIQKEKRRWLVVAAGVDASEAQKLFSGTPKRAEKALIPLRYKANCKISLLFVLRPFDNDLNSVSESIFVAPFAPRKRIPLVEIRQSYLRVSQIPGNKNQLNNLRWEWDIANALNTPVEKWLRNWNDDCGFNPAHPPSHLHLNSDRYDSSPKKSQRPVDTEIDLRLAIGKPNPLALLLSIATWLRRL